MSFAKAVQHTRAPEYLRYIGALSKYKKACAIFAKTRRRYATATAPLERLVFLEAKETFSRESKEYHAERAGYNDFIVQAKLKDKGINVKDIHNALGIQIANSLKDVIDEVKRETVVANMTDEEFEQMRQLALDVMNKRNAVKTEPVETVKEQFLRIKPTSTDDPTLDMSDTI